MSAACESLIGLGATEATLWVIGANTQGRSFYEKQGWQLDGSERTRHERRELRYRKRIV